MLDFQAAVCASSNMPNRSPQSHNSQSTTHFFPNSRAVSNSYERLERLSINQLARRLARSMEARLNSVRGDEGDRAESTAGNGSGGNYVDICPLQTLAINELLRSTL